MLEGADGTLRRRLSVARIAAEGAMNRAPTNVTYAAEHSVLTAQLESLRGRLSVARVAAEGAMNRAPTNVTDAAEHSVRDVR